MGNWEKPSPPLWGFTFHGTALALFHRARFRLHKLFFPTWGSLSLTASAGIRPEHPISGRVKLWIVWVHYWLQSLASCFCGKNRIHARELRECPANPRPPASP